jgi:hypothetical protein
VEAAAAESDEDGLVAGLAATVSLAAGAGAFSFGVEGDDGLMGRFLQEEMNTRQTMSQYSNTVDQPRQNILQIAPCLLEEQADWFVCDTLFTIE